VKASGIALAAVLAVSAGIGVHTGSASAAASAVGSGRALRVPNRPLPKTKSSSRAPSKPPLTSGQAGSSTSASIEEEVSDAPQAEADPLVSNGLGSPACQGTLSAELSATSRRNCETSGFAAAPAPTGDYGIDVHIDGGVLSPTAWGSSITQDLLITPLWMGLVWAVHALVVMLEWSFSINLLDSSAAAGIGTGLRQMQNTFTEPWLPVALATASVLALYHGLIRRRVAETLGEALLMAAMMVAGIWVITNPAGTVGALGQWANQASLGTLAVASRGTPAEPGRALGNSLETVFVAAIEVPWCYLEFGDVGWCRDPSRLDPRLRSAALKIATHQLALRACEPSWTPLVPCAKATSAQASALEHSAELLRAARSNGALFLALPANDGARNSINEEGSLLRTLCQSSEATNCHGPTAAQAEFRTASGTLWRLGGVVLIAAGLLGMMLLLGFMAVRLLSAAVFSLLFLLLAPAMVLAPAFGESGRALFRKWAACLLGAVVSKLVFSFLLGILLAVISVLAELEALGWWTQWLLMSAFWWGAYTHRNQLIGVAEGTLTQQRSASEHTRRHSLLGRMRQVAESNQLIAAARWAKDRRAKPAADVEQRRKQALAGHERARAGADEQVHRSLESEHRDASARAEDAPEINRRLSAKRSQLERLGRERGTALAGGNTRRAAELKQRAKRVKGEIEHEQGVLNSSRRVAKEAEWSGGERYPRARLQERARFLDAQAALASGAQARGAEQRRDYQALAGLAGYKREEYQRLDPGSQRAARLEIDRELALRKELANTAQGLAGADGSGLGRRERRGADRKFDSALQKRMREGGHSMPASRSGRTALDLWREQGRAPRNSNNDRGPRSDRSSVMRDAREVAARRKRQLGRDRP
jgi:hypothetical protein